MDPDEPQDLYYNDSEDEDERLRLQNDYMVMVY